MIASTVARASAADFESIVWPAFADELGGGHLLMTERGSSDLERALDLFAMTDAWQILTSHGARSLASRVQWGPHNWESWTVRCRLRSGARTEYHKILAADSGWHLPSYFLQAYITEPGGDLISAAAIAGHDLRKVCVTARHLRGPRRNPADGTLFYWVAWEDAEWAGAEVIRRP